VRADQAQPVMPMSTLAVTEDLATAMALHSTGWDSCYHDEVLARGLAPLELRAALTQRLRWAEGTMQMLLRQNPLRVKGLSTGQRLMYMATMLSYLSGFASVVYLSAPPLYIFAGVMPVRAYSWELLAWLAPYLLLNAVLFALVGWRRHTWRGQQYALVLFPVWIRSVFHAVAEVWFGRRLEFATTPKTLESRGLDLRPVAVQLATIAVLVVAGAYGITSLLLGERDDTLAMSLNGLWIVYDLVMLSVVIKAVTFRPSDADLARSAAAIWRDADDVPGRIGAGRR
jgi:cellulose synthase (UDP-forming)